MFCGKTLRERESRSRQIVSECCVVECFGATADHCLRAAKAKLGVQDRKNANEGEILAFIIIALKSRELL